MRARSRLPTDVLVLQDLLQRVLALVRRSGAVVSTVDAPDEESVEERLLDQLRVMIRRRTHGLDEAVAEAHAGVPEEEETALDELRAGVVPHVHVSEELHDAGEVLRDRLGDASAGDDERVPDVDDGAEELVEPLESLLVVDLVDGVVRGVDGETDGGVDVLLALVGQLPEEVGAAGEEVGLDVALDVAVAQGGEERGEDGVGGGEDGREDLHLLVARELVHGANGVENVSETGDGAATGVDVVGRLDGLHEEGEEVGLRESETQSLR